MDFQALIDAFIKRGEKMIEEENLDFKEGDDEELWQKWENTKENKAKLLNLPYNVRIIDGLFYYLLENFGTKLLLLAFEYYDKNRDKYQVGTDYTAILNYVLPHICLKYLKKHINTFRKEVNEFVLKEMIDNPKITIHEAKIKAIRRLLC